MEDESSELDEPVKVSGGDKDSRSEGGGAGRLGV